MINGPRSDSKLKACSLFFVLFIAVKSHANCMANLRGFFFGGGGGGGGSGFFLYFAMIC